MRTGTNNPNCACERGWTCRSCRHELEEEIRRLKENTVQTLRDDLFAGGQQEVTCPVCDKKCIAWTKSIVSCAAVDLLRLTIMYVGEALHIDDFTQFPKDRNFSQLKLWGLIVPHVNEDTKKRASGMWHPTDKAYHFVEGSIRLRKYVTTYNNFIVPTPEDKCDQYVYFRDVLGQKFDYSELMATNGIIIE